MPWLICVQLFLTKPNVDRRCFRRQRNSAQHGFTEAEILRYAAYAEAFSTHPIAESIKQAMGRKLSPGLSPITRYPWPRRAHNR